MSLDRPTLFIRLLQTYRTFEDRLRDNYVDLHMRRSPNLKIKNLYDNVYLASFGRKFITDLVQLIGSTRPKFDV